MKRITTLLIILLAVIIFAAVGWYLFIRNPEIPLGEAIKQGLPFGSGEDLDVRDVLMDSSPDITNEDEVPDQFSSPASELFRLSISPVAGSVVFERGNELVVRFVDRATGNIYDSILPTSTSTTEVKKTRLTNNTLPKIYEAYFRADGSSVLLRTLKEDSDTVENTSITITAPSAQATSTEFYNVTSTALRGDMGSVAVGSGNALFYSLKDTASIVTSTFTGTGAKDLLKSAFTDWRLVSRGSTLLVHTKASGNALGYAYTLNTSNGSLTKLVGPFNGLVAIPNASGNRVLYSYSQGGVVKLVALNTQDDSSSEISPTTFAEKCVWSTKDIESVICAAPIDTPRGSDLDLWYKGAKHFSDRIWKFDTKEDVAQVLEEPKSLLGVDIDAVDLKLSPDEDYLIFINKNDLSLWALKLQDN